MSISSTPSLRVVHLPFNVPYARKMKPPGVSIVNGTSNVPDLASIEWAADPASSMAYDICHLHFFELTPAAVLRDCVLRCKANGKPVLVTLHDIVPIHGCNPDEYREKIRVLATEADALVTLTSGAAREVQRNVASLPAIIELPLGYVVEPSHEQWSSVNACRSPVRFAAFGSLRRNRRIDLLVQAFHRLPAGIDAVLRLLVRPIRTTTALDLDDIRRYECPRVSVRIQSEISDEEVIEFVADSDVLVLPYEWVCHSGQLELAFDMAVGVVAPTSGHLQEQWRLSERFVQTPTWFEWTAQQDLSKRLVALGDALEKAYSAARSVRTDACEREAYRQHRRSEFVTFLETYERIYCGLKGVSC